MYTDYLRSTIVTSKSSAAVAITDTTIASLVTGFKAERKRKIIYYNILLLLTQMIHFPASQ